MINMGIIVNEPFMTDLGFEITGCYVRVNNVGIEKVRANSEGTIRYIVGGQADVYASKDAYTQEKSKIKRLRIEDALDDIPSDLYAAMYNKIKQEYTNYIDDN